MTGTPTATTVREQPQAPGPGLCLSPRQPSSSTPHSGGSWPHFQDEETEGSRASRACPRPQSERGEGRNLHPAPSPKSFLPQITCPSASRWPSSGPDIPKAGTQLCAFMTASGTRGGAGGAEIAAPTLRTPLVQLGRWTSKRPPIPERALSKREVTGGGGIPADGASQA